MPAVNHIVLASGAVMAVSVAVATAIAIYESPELRRYADDVRRRIAMALHTVGDGINPPHREPLFNRPEDSEGFLQSRRGAGAEPGVDADDETRRRQREELLYWNSLRLQKEQEKEQAQAQAQAQEKNEETRDRPLALEDRPRAGTRGSSFDDFLRPDASEQGAYVFNTGAQVRGEQGDVRRRGDGARSLNASLYANPFADEHHIDVDEIEEETQAAHTLAPGKEEVMSDIYSATTRDGEELQPEPQRPEFPAGAGVALLDLESTPSHTETSATLERELDVDEYMTAGQDRDDDENDHREEAYASIQAWAQGSSPDFYSPLPVTPMGPGSEPELVSTGELTPTDSVSIVGSAEDHDLVSRDGDGDEGRLYDVMSESEGMATPASWSEVGSVVSDNDVPLRAL